MKNRTNQEKGRQEEIRGGGLQPLWRCRAPQQRLRVSASFQGRQRSRDSDIGGALWAPTAVVNRRSLPFFLIQIRFLDSWLPNFLLFLAC